MEFGNIRRLLSHARRAVDEYHMIEEGDRIAVGVSGGKDSLALLAVMRNLQLFYPKRFVRPLSRSFAAKAPLRCHP